MCRPNWKHGLALYHPPCYLRAIDFPTASVMYHWRAVHRWITSLFWKPHSSVEKHILLDKKIFKKANRVKWIEAKQLSFIYFLFCYYSLIYFILYYFIFSPSTFSSMHVRTMRTGSYAPAKVLFIKITSVLTVCVTLSKSIGHNSIDTKAKEGPQTFCFSLLIVEFRKGSWKLKLSAFHII